MDVEHPALQSKSGLRYGAAWRDAQAAATILGLDYDTFSGLSRDVRLTVVAQYEIQWRIEALLDFERNERTKLNANRAKRNG